MVCVAQMNKICNRATEVINKDIIYILIITRQYIFPAVVITFRSFAKFLLESQKVVYYTTNSSKKY